MATWIEADWHNQADGDSPAESAQVAAKNSSLECDIDVSVTLARTNYAAGSKRLGPYVELTSEKSGLSLDDDSILDGDLDKDFPPGDSVLLIPDLLDVSLPKNTIAADPLDLSLSDEVLLHSPLLRKPLETIEEEPELEAQMELEHPPERNPEELSTHMEEEPAPLVLDALPPLKDPELSTEHGNDALRDPLEPHLQASAQSLAESAVPRPESSNLSLKDEEEATSKTAPIAVEDPAPPRPKSPYQARNRPTVSSAHTQASIVGEPTSTRAGAEKLAPPSLNRSPLGGRRKPAEAPSSRSLGSESTVVAKGQVASQFLEKIGQLRGAAVLAEGGHDTYTLADDLMSIEGAQKQPEKCKKEEFGELFNKRPANAAQSPSKSTAEAESDEEESALDFDHLPIRRRMDIWKRREHRAIRKGLIVIPKMSKQGRFPISAAGL